MDYEESDPRPAPAAGVETMGKVESEKGEENILLSNLFIKTRKHMKMAIKWETYGI